MFYHTQRKTQLATQVYWITGYLHLTIEYTIQGETLRLFILQQCLATICHTLLNQSRCLSFATVYIMQYSYSLKQLNLIFMQDIIAYSISSPTYTASDNTQTTAPCTIQLISYETMMCNGLQFYFIASVNQMNLLVVCWLKLYACTGQLAIAAIQSIEFAMDS